MYSNGRNNSRRVFTSNVISNAKNILVDRLVRFDTNTGLELQGSGVTITDEGDMSGVSSIAFTGSNESTITLTAPASVVSHTLTFPENQGTAGTVLTNNGSGVLTWGMRPVVVLIGNFSNFVANTSTTFMNWGVSPSNVTSYANTIRMGRSGRITMITATYVNGTAIVLTAGQSVTFTMCYLENNQIPNAVTNYTDGTFLTWAEDLNGTFPSTTTAVNYAFTATTQFSMYTIEINGPISSTTADINLVIYCELDN